MSIPATSITHAEVILAGVVAAAGSSSKNMNLVMHLRRTSTSPTLTKAALQSILATNWRGAFLACVSLRLTLTHWSIRWIDDALDAPVLTSDTHPGAVTGDSMPLTTAAFLLMQTGIRGRSYRGSKHVFPLGESATTVLTDDIFNAGALTYLGNFAAALLASNTDSNGNIWVPQVLSKKLSQLRTNPTTVVANDVTAILVGKRVGTMRHRRVASQY
jgi:hypothetical protein